MSFWSRYFTFSKGCAYCKNEECKKVSFKVPRTDGNTSGLSKHMRSYHLADYELILKEKAAKEEKKVKEEMAGG
eukprot:scaffold1577_cov284-Ochromonas_danica.AAC.2